MPELSNQMKRVMDVVARSYRLNYPISLADLSREQIERVNMCTQVAKRFQDNPLMNVNEFLRVVFHRTPSQIYLDKKLILFIRNLRYGTDDRDTAMFIAEAEAKQIMSIGHQTGDPKWIDKGLEKYIKIKQLDQPAPQEDLMENTSELPVVFVEDISEKDPNRRRIDDDARRALLRQYGASDDEISQLIDDEKKKLISSSPAPATVPDASPAAPAIVPAASPAGSQPSSDEPSLPSDN